MLNGPSMEMTTTGMASGESLGLPVVPDFYLFPAAPPHLARMRPKASALNTYFTPSENKNVSLAFKSFFLLWHKIFNLQELLSRQLVTLAQPDPTRMDVPHEVESYRQLCPLEQRPPEAETPGYFLAHRSSVYKSQNAKDGLHYCLRRLYGRQYYIIILYCIFYNN